MTVNTNKIAKLAHVDLKNFGTSTTQRERVLREFLREPIHPKSAATAAITAFVISFCSRVVILALAFFGMPQRSSRAIERFRLIEGNLDKWVDELETRAIRRFFVEIVSLIANRVTLPAFHPMIVVIENLFERSTVNHRLIAFETFALLPLNASIVTERNSIPSTMRHGRTSRLRIWIP